MRRNVTGKKYMVAVISAAMALLITGCAANSASAKAGAEENKTTEVVAATEKEAVTVAGAMLLSVNPEIEMEFDTQGLVLELKAINEDGQAVLAQLEDYQGKDCQTIVNELIKKIYEGGYLENPVLGKTKNIVIKIEQGSEMPDETFLETIAGSVSEAVADCGGESSPVLVTEEDLERNGIIGLEKAKELAMAQVGVTGAEFTEHTYELDDNVYELEFTSGGIVYEVEVNAITGKVSEADFENNEDWNSIKEPDDTNEEDDTDDQEDVDAEDDTDDVDGTDDWDDTDEVDDADDWDDTDDVDDTGDWDDTDDVDDTDDWDDTDDVDDTDDWDDTDEVDDTDDWDDTDEVDDTDDWDDTDDGE